MLGEEFGLAGGGERCWVLDPIDGTKNFVRGIPVWGSLIALEVGGKPVVGVVSAPALGRRWWAGQALGSYATGGTRLQVSGVAALEDAMFSYDSMAGFADLGLGEAARDLEERCWRSRGFGDFWSHVLVAEGAVDVAAEPDLEHWDMAPLQVIVEEAGGRFTDLAGVARPDGGSAVSTNGLLHDAVLAVLGGRSAGAPQGHR